MKREMDDIKIELKKKYGENTRKNKRDDKDDEEGGPSGKITIKRQI